MSPESPAASAMRIGTGYDVHRHGSDEARPLVLGGVTFAGWPGLVGHSDADVVAHAVADALLSAAGLGDLGSAFPDTDDAYRGADSLGLLAEAAHRAAGAGWVPVNIDCTVVCDRPKLAEHREEMQRRLSEAVGGAVTVAGRRVEGMGAIGRGEGIAAWAVALVVGR